MWGIEDIADRESEVTPEALLNGLQYDKAVLLHYLEERPDDSLLHEQLGKVVFDIYLMKKKIARKAENLLS